jgi:CxxC motif-containing protein (DUF1111 family)
MRPMLMISALAVLLFAGLDRPAAAEGRDRAARFRHDGRVEPESAVAPEAGSPAAAASEAPAGFDNLTNGYLEQGPDFETLDDDSVVALRGCATCHTPAIVTAPPGTVVNGGEFTVPEALGSKIIRPYSDFLLHDIGTGDGVPVLPTPEYAATARQVKTAPLWGLRTRSRLMHDGLTFSKEEAIERHRGQASEVTSRYRRLTGNEKKQVLAFLDSL